MVNISGNPSDIYYKLWAWSGIIDNLLIRVKTYLVAHPKIYIWERILKDLVFHNFT